MRRPRLRRASDADLVSAYIVAAEGHGKATESEDRRAANRRADELALIYAVLRQRGLQAQRALLPLLRHENLVVRLWAACHALEFLSAEGEPVLVALAQHRGFIGLDADTALKEWRSGTLKFPDPTSDP